MSVSYENSKIIFQGIKDASVASLPALPETWLGPLLQQPDRDPDVRLILSGTVALTTRDTL
jgi:hypothetical protein